MKEWAYEGIKSITGAIHRQEVSSVEVLHYFQDRIAKINPRLNAVIAQNKPQAEAMAKQADEEIAAGNIRGPLHGLPMTIKDSYEVVGMTTTSGARRWKKHEPNSNAVAVQRLLDAGVVPLGKTNVPYLTADWQSYNKIYGKTNNPWDITKTPGGSSGGAAAAIAAGLTPAELGSDIGGSIRIPAHYCGVFGHKPTYDIVSLRGHIPGPPGLLSEPDLAVAGPLAQNTADLELLLHTVLGADPDREKAWQIKLPNCPHKKLQQFRVLACFEHPVCPLDNVMWAEYELLIQKLKTAGVQVDESGEQVLPLQEAYRVYLSLLGAQFANGLKRMQKLQLKVLAPVVKHFGQWAKSGPMIEHYLAGMTMSHGTWLDIHEQRLQLKRQMEKIFEQYDVILMPNAPTTAIPHDIDTDFRQRRISVNGKSRPYTDHFPWISLATALGLPATSAPIGVTDGHLPMNVQIIGGPYADKTTLRFSKLMEAITGGMSKPPNL